MNRQVPTIWRASLEWACVRIQEPVKLVEPPQLSVLAMGFAVLICLQVQLNMIAKHRS